MQKEDTSDKGLKARAALSLAVLGIVYGDIGTSPLYALRESVVAAGGPSQAHVLGALSLMAWALFLVVTFKYVLVVLRVDNGGEGGILALTALALQSKSRRGRRHRWLLIMGLLGAALFYGDCVITPAISVLSAMEGIEVLAPDFQHFVMPAALVLLIGLFVIQQFGTAKVGMLFGPIIALWFLVLALLGAIAIVENPSVLRAFDPRYGIDLLLAAPTQAAAVLGAVVLTVTGAEALYADLGHFGRRPIALLWLRFVFPSLLINYFGQGALLLARPEAIENPFYLLAPSWSLPFMIALAAAATIIASQAVISGAFSLTQQAVQLGYLPRITVRHTSAETKGQVFVPLVSSMQATLVAFVVMEFGSSSALASAYGIAVTGTMALTAILGVAAWRVKKGGSPAAAIALFGFFLLIDLIFFSANATKVASGGWLPLGLGAVVFLIMRTWIMGRQALLARRISGAIPLPDFLKSSSIAKMNRVAGTAVYMVAEPRYTPTALLHNMKHNKVLHDRVVVLAVKVEDVPHVPKGECVKIERLAENFFMVIARIGFTEEANIPRILVLCRAAALEFVMEQTSFFISREKVVVGRISSLSRWRRRLFILLTRSMTNVTDYFHLPPNRVVELGGQIEL